MTPQLEIVLAELLQRELARMGPLRELDGGV